ncbi:MAG: hypothetical protein WB987_01480 [Candidatus Acidiferrales bacterium]
MDAAATKPAFLLFVLLLPLNLLAQSKIPAGTILPVSLERSISSRKSHVGEKISARVTQDVPLPGGDRIREGARVVGEIVSVGPSAGGAGARVSFRFNSLVLPRLRLPITTNLRALASPLEIDSAQLSIYGGDRGTPSSAWTTVQVGGEVVYRGGGPVVNGNRKVGEPVPDGVLVEVAADPAHGCRGGFGENSRPQALWLFSSDACGIYGYPRVTIVHSGRTDPTGVIVLASASGEINIRGASGLLLRVNGGS